MGWNQKIEYIEVQAQDILPLPPVKKQIWDGEKFVTVMQYRVAGILSKEQKDWLYRTFGQKGNRWNFTDSGRFYIMDEQVYMIFKLKWSQNQNQEA